MKNFFILVVIILVIIGVFFVMKPYPTSFESEYLEFKIGSQFTSDMKATNEAEIFKVKSEVYYSIFSKKPFDENATIEVNIRNYNNLNEIVFTEKFPTVDKKVVRPINPINSDKAGKYLIEVKKDNRVLAQKVFTITN